MRRNTSDAVGRAARPPLPHGGQPPIVVLEDDMTLLNMLADAAKRIAEGLGVLDKLKARWVNAPAEAREKLADNLEAVHHFYETFDDTLGEFLQIDPAAKPRILREKLQPFRTAKVDARLANARFHCHEIAHTYTNHLKGWFSKETGLLTSEERNTLQRLFLSDLGEADDALISHIQELSRWMREVALQIEQLASTQQIDAAGEVLEET